ncbi:MAG TPA: RecQ family ATP-dependent DNA helicase [Methylomirabilota bacterium]|nr:RecQ family ATP-dependent DNA helicase [Methylomirabilota bacterium]
MRGAAAASSLRGPAASLDLSAGLARLGYTAFRPGQREAVETLLAEGRLLLVAPTGGGKSLTYQLPAALLPGTSLVISPLVSLMHDQMAALVARGVPATYLAATLSAEELRARMRSLASGAFRLAYVAPERLAFPGFRGLLRDLDCPLVAVDEAHCISEWGHDFRPEYLEIGGLLAELPRAAVLACTATATPVVRDEILARLGLPADTRQMVRGFARPNLGLRAVTIGGPRERGAQVDGVLAEMLGRPRGGRGTGIVYAPTRKSAEEEAARLAALGWRTEVYHAGLAGAARERAQRAFAEGRAELVVATNAFGMGIDRPDVRAVIHLAPPGSIEAYYQEVGRAGRDGAPAVGLLLTSARDLPLRRALLERGSEGAPPPEPDVVEHKWGLFLELVRWAEGGSCRHDAILRYFGDEAETLHGCGRCDVCVALAAGGGDGVGEHDAEAVSLIVRKALSGVARVHGRFGLGTAVKLIRGEAEPRLERAGLTRVPTFGNLREHGETWLVAVLRRCVAAGWVSFTGGDRPVVVLTDEGRAVMKGERPARLLLPPASAGAPRPDDGARRRAGLPKRAPASDDPIAAAAAEALFEALRRHRLGLARAEGIAPFMVASDRTLRDIALLKPRTLHDLLLAHGIGRHKAERYGAGFLEVVAQHG